MPSGESILKADGSYGKVQSARLIDHAQVMYNLTIHDDHDYFVGSGQWLVHNFNCVPVKYGSDPISQAAQNFRLLNKFRSGDVAVFRLSGEIPEDLVGYVEQYPDFYRLDGDLLAAGSRGSTHAERSLHILLTDFGYSPGDVIEACTELSPCTGANLCSMLFANGGYQLNLQVGYSFHYDSEGRTALRGAISQLFKRGSIGPIP